MNVSSLDSAKCLFNDALIKATLTNSVASEKIPIASLKYGSPIRPNPYAVTTKTIEV